MATHSSILAWKTACTGEPGGLRPWGHKELDRTEHTHTHTHTHTHMSGTGAPPMTKVMRKEAPHTQRRDQASGVPLEILEHLPPKPESAYFLLCALTYTSDFTGEGGCCHPLPLSEKRVNLQLQLMKFLGVIVFQPTNSFGSPLACLNRFFRPHVIAQSLPTVRGRRCFKLSNHRFL